MNLSNNPTCETFELSLSALIDGELESPEQLPAVDHLLQCGACQDFYRRARTLGAIVASATAESTEPPPAALWDRIVTETGLEKRGIPAGAERPPWPRKRRDDPSAGKPRYLSSALRLAGVLVAALGLWLLRPLALETREDRPSGETGVIDVVLEQDRGSMSEERFLELATEILRADRGYHRKMLEIMTVVDGMAPRPEGSGDEPAFAARDALRGFDDEGDGASASPWSGDQL